MIVVATTPNNTTPDNLLLPTCQCACTLNQRTVSDIIWSCFATIVVCTWTSVHPNIPGLDEGWWKVTRRKFELMIWGIIAPEAIFLWAMRQWGGARRIQKRVLCERYNAV